MDHSEVILDLEKRHSAALQDAAETDDDDAHEEMMTIADGIAATMSCYRAATVEALDAKARVVDRQLCGRLLSSLLAIGIADWRLIESVVDDLIALTLRTAAL